MSNLKPCPFCGGEAVRADCVGCGYLQIRCSKCLAIVTVTLADRDNLAAIKKDEERLITNWNRRALRCGDWKMVKRIGGMILQCSECGGYTTQPTKYCPTCGAYHEGGIVDAAD